MTVLFAPLLFCGTFGLALLGALAWGFGLRVHELAMSAAIARMIPHGRRTTAYGLFMTIFGAAWLVGSAVQGAIYDLSISALVAVALLAPIVGLFPIWVAAHRYRV